MGRSKDALFVANKALIVAKQVKKLVNVEYKFFDIISTGTVIPNGVGTIVQLSNIPQGDTDITRDGAQVKLTTMDFTANIIVNTSAANTGSLITVMLVEDRQTNEAIYATADLLENVVDGLSPLSALNLDNKYRFKVMKRWIFQLNTASNPRKVIKCHYKFPNNMKLRFDNSTSTIADLTSRSLSLLFISNEATNEPSIVFFNRIRYIDN